MQFVKLAGELKEEHGDGIAFLYCDAKAIAKATDLPPSVILKNLAGVSIVPTLQCWRKGQVDASRWIIPPSHPSDSIALLICIQLDADDKD